jgi:hypothetical protein
MRGRSMRVAVLAATLMVAAASSAQQHGDSFTADERARLAAGELVVRSVTRQQGSLSLIGGTSWKVLDTTPEITWRALCDSPQYRRMFPSTEESQIVAHSPGERVVRFRHNYGPVSALYHLRMRFDHEHRDIAFRLDRERPSDLRAAWGFLSARPYGETGDRTLVSWGIMVDLGGGLLGGIFRGSAHEQVLRVPQTVGEYLDGAGRGRYDD